MRTQSSSMEDNFTSNMSITMKAGYLTHDVFTNPPTPIQIVSAELLPLLPTEEQQQQQHGAFFITFDDIEPTAGWLADRNNASLDICFMHSFGKCYGKAKDRDPRTCHQIHVRREVLNRIRQRYILPHRTYFCRTIKCNVSNDFILHLSLVAKRRLSLQYLEFKTEDVIPTCDSLAYEVEYRNWLFNDNNSTDNINGCGCGNYNVSRESSNDYSSKRLDSFQRAPQLTNFISKFNLCSLFSMNGKCEMSSACNDIHVDISKALSKDRTIRFALEQLSRCTNRDQECSQVAPTLLLTPTSTTVISTLAPVNVNNLSHDKHFKNNKVSEQQPVISNLSESSQQFNLYQPLVFDGNVPCNLPFAFPNNNIHICPNEFCGNQVEDINCSSITTNNINNSINSINYTLRPSTFLTTNNNNSQNEQECLCTGGTQNENNNRFTNKSNDVAPIQRLLQVPLQQEPVLCNSQVCHNICRGQLQHTHQHLPYLLQTSTSPTNTILINNSSRGNEYYNSYNSVNCSTPMFVVDERGELWLRLAPRTIQLPLSNNHNTDSREKQHITSSESV